MKTAATALTLLVTLLFAAAASAAADAGKAYGGGHLPPRGFAKAALITALVSDDGNSVQMFVEAPASCGAGTLNAKVALNSDGAFVLSGTTRDRTRFNDKRTTVYSGSGTFEGAHATGTLQMSIKIAPRGRRAVKCKASFPFVLHEQPNPSATPPAGVPQPSAQYNGLTSQGYGFVAHTAADAKSITTAALDYDIKCRKFTDFRNEFTPVIKIGADGTWKLTEHFTESFKDGRETITVRGAGAFLEGAVTGSLKITSVFRNKRKNVTDRCKTPVIDFFAQD